MGSGLSPLTAAGPQNNPAEIPVVGTATPTKELLGSWTERTRVRRPAALLIAKPDFLPPQDMLGWRRGGTGLGSALFHTSWHHGLYKNEQVEKPACLDNTRG